MMAPLSELPGLDADGRIEVLIEVPRFSFVKRDHEGRVQLVSPLPCPFNYGSLPGTCGPDGDPIDALVLGVRRSRGERARVRVRGVVRFMDAGAADPKWICSEQALTTADVRDVERFFSVYSVAKRVLNGLLERPAPTRFERVELA
jgi:inorganic pyrophosphatase